MQAGERYKNGQIVHEQKGDILYYYFKHGGVKAFGRYVDGQMEGEWTFYRDGGQLWQIGHFLHNLKHGSWVRYNRSDEVEYQESFENGKAVKPAKQGETGAENIKH